MFVERTGGDIDDVIEALINPIAITSVNLS